MRKSVIIQAPFKSISGYGLKALDIVESIVELYPQWNISLKQTSWGSNPNREYTKVDHLLIDQITFQPDVFIQIGLPNEFQPIGRDKNILFTSGIETSKAPKEWVEYMNLMDVTIVPSEFTKQSFLDSDTKPTKPIEVIFEGYDEEIYSPSKKTSFPLVDIKNDFVYLFVGQYTGGSVFGEDRKNIGNMIRIFLQTFANKVNPPALLIKSNMGNFSKVDQYQYLEFINMIKRTVDAKNLPDIYLLHGELSDQQMNGLYNNPKIKAMISLTKGEGFGRPLLEFATTGKPILVSNHSGHLDFLKPEHHTLLDGQLDTIHPSTVSNMFLPDSKWFNVNPNLVYSHLITSFNNYKPYKDKSSKSTGFIKSFTKSKMKLKIKSVLDEHIPESVELKLPDFLLNQN